MRYAAFDSRRGLGRRSGADDPAAAAVLHADRAVRHPRHRLAAFSDGHESSSVVRQTAVINIMALGMTVIIISGGIDLSVGSILAMAGLLGTMAMEKYGIALGHRRRAGRRNAVRPGERVHDHGAADQPVHRDAGHAGDLSRPGADHFERPAGAQDSRVLFVSGGGHAAGRAVRAVDSARRGGR